MDEKRKVVAPELPDSTNFTLNLASQQTQALVPKAPDALTTEGNAEVQKQVDQIANTIEQSLSSRSFMLSIDDLGRPEQQLATQRIELIETRVNAVIGKKAEDPSVPNALVEMRQALDDLNPSRGTQSFTARVVENIPVIGEPIMNWWWSSGLRQTAMKRETIRQQVLAVKESLEQNRQRQLADNVQLASLYDFLRKSVMFELQRSAYALELLAGKIETMMSTEEPESDKRKRLQVALERVAVRAMHLRSTENALQQGLATIDVTIDGNQKLAESLEQTASLTTSYLTVAMALYQALSHQKQALQAVIRARRGTEEVMVKTSEMAREGAAAITEVYYNPAVALQAVQQAHNNLMAALTQIEQASQQGLVTAKTSIQSLRHMTEELAAKQERLRSGQQVPEIS